ncbi:MAG: RluA family pseudouridine synthase [Planctomycetota bacterium]|nr:RluA family pseudouridine synthase [Planctomycetota bacterium]
MLDVLYEDNHLLVVNKPAGLATMGVQADEASMVTVARQYLKQKYDKPGNVYIGVVSRLDAMVSGALILARTSKGAARLSQQLVAGSVAKVYLAWLEGVIEPAAAQWTDWLIKDEQQHRMQTIHPNRAAQLPDAREARLSYRRLQTVDDRSLVEIHLDTGRKHQIRVQFSAHGFPIYGDSKYGGHQRLRSGIGLHARQLSFDHPTTKERITITAPLPPVWKKAFG